MVEKFEEEIESEGYKCPYCKEMHICDDWDYEDETIDCHCGKKFIATADHSVTFHSTPDCELNGEKHKLKYHSEETHGKVYFCEICNECMIELDGL